MKTKLLTERKSERQPAKTVLQCHRPMIAGLGPVPSVFRPRFRPLSTVYCLLFTVLWLPPCRAGIPEPDNLVYGLIALGTNLVTAQRTNVMVEVQRPTGQVLHSYRIGQNPAFGNHYVVEIPLESGAELKNPAASAPGSNLVLVVKETVVVARVPYTYVRFQTNVVAADRGTVERIDFGVLPTNVVSGFEAWAATHGLGAGSDNLDPDGDRQSNFNEYLAGTDPNDPNSRFALAVEHSGGGARVSFVARRAEGVGYANQTRHYALEGATNLPVSVWFELGGLTDILGNNQTVIVPLSATNAEPEFYRGRVELRGP